MRRLITGLFLLITATSFAQKEQGQDELGAWYMYFGLNRLSDKWSIHTEVQGRFYEPFSNFNQAMFRVGANYHISDKAMATAGYAYIPTESYDKGNLLKSTSEHRIWQQFILKNLVGRFYFEHRYRLEQRWVKNLQTDQVNYNNRMRYRLMISMPINNPEMLDNTLYLGVYNELFMRLEADPYDQNRLYFSLGYKVNSVWNFQAGFLRNNIRNLDYNRLQFAAFINPDFRKKE